MPQGSEFGPSVLAKSGRFSNQEVTDKLTKNGVSAEMIAMLMDVVTAETTREEWGVLRERVRARFLGSLGEPGGLRSTPAFSWEETYAWNGLEVRPYRIEAVEGFPVEGAVFVPPEPKEAEACPTVYAMPADHLHLERPRSMHTTCVDELPRRGYWVLSTNQIGFPVGTDEAGNIAEAQRFYAAYPEWSLDGARAATHAAVLDILTRELPISSRRLATIGNSKGGRAAEFQALVDDRVGAVVASTGVSPEHTNIWRYVNRAKNRVTHSPSLPRAVEERGRSLYDYHEVMALMAPRGYLMLEPYNDPYNPYIEAVFACFQRARHVYELMGAPEQLQLLTHGDGHVATPNVRAYAYDWIEEQFAFRGEE